MTAPGDIARRLVLQAPIDADDGQGGVARSYGDADVVWAEVLPLKASGAAFADAVNARALYRITIRKGPDMSLHHRFRDGARIFNILTYREDSDRRFLEITAEEIQS